MSESEFRKITGIEKNGEVLRGLVIPSLGPSLPTAVINRDRIYAVKEIQVPRSLPVANLIMESGGSTANPVVIGQETTSKNQDQADEDTEYQGDEMDEEFEEDESSGQGGVGGGIDFKSTSRAVNGTNLVDEVDGNEI